jgi:hypothetical protein
VLDAHRRLAFAAPAEDAVVVPPQASEARGAEKRSIDDTSVLLEKRLTRLAFSATVTASHVRVTRRALIFFLPR